MATYSDRVGWEVEVSHDRNVHAIPFKRFGPGWPCCDRCILHRDFKYWKSEYASHDPYQASWPATDYRVDLTTAGKYMNAPITVIDKQGNIMKTQIIQGKAGYNLFAWNLIIGRDRSQPQRAGPGEYKVELTVGKLKLEGKLLVKNYVK